MDGSVSTPHNAGARLATVTLKLVVGSIALAVSAKLQVPFWPVPMTMQTLVVLLLGAGFGSRVGTLCVLAYLAEGAAGLPVFAGSVAGPAYMAGPTGGFLLGFVPAAFAMGSWVERGFGSTLPRALAAALAAHAVLFATGLLWLGSIIGWDKALTAGLFPFVAGTLVKSGIVAGLVRVAPARLWAQPR